MKKFESFTQLEKIPIMEFLQPFIDSQFFIEEELEEDFSKYPNNVISEYIFDEDMFEYFTENDPNFAYMLRIGVKEVVVKMKKLVIAY